MKKHFKKIISVAVAVVILVSVCAVGMLTPHASGTGAGLAEWALGAYNNHWRYVYGGSSAGAVDCSGLIYSYCGGARTGTAQLNSATQSGNVSSGIPRVHGLGLYQPGHVGVYVGGGMAVDARNEYYGVCYEATASKSWTKWFKLSAVTYVTEGWEKFNGSYYYYEDGQYVVSTSRRIGGVTYNFNSSGVSDKTPENMSAVANKGSDSGNSSDNSNSGGESTKSTSPQTSTSSALKLGSSGDSVTKLQNRLTELGFYHNAVTGYFGENTEAAYKAFQKAAGVTVDGIAGKSDLEILYSSNAPKAQTAEEPEEDETPTEAPTEASAQEKDTYQLGDQDDEIVKIQQRLAELNFYNEDFTGYFGDITQYGVLMFQKANGLAATGVVDKETYNALFSENASENPIYTTPADEDAEEEETEPETAEEVYEDTQPIEDTQPAETVSSVAQIAEENLEDAQEVVVKSSKLTRQAIASVQKDERKAVKISAQDKNTSFVMWLLIVLGFATVVSVVFFVANRRNSSYRGTREKSKRENVTVRYW